VVLLTGQFLETTWAVDSGATHHFCNDLSYFAKDSMVKVEVLVRLGDDKTLVVHQKGVATLVLDDILLAVTALYVPEFHLSLLSVSELALQDFTTVFTDFCSIYNNKSALILRVRPTNGLYVFKSSAFKSSALLLTSNPIQFPNATTNTIALITKQSGGKKDIPSVHRITPEIQKQTKTAPAISEDSSTPSTSPSADPSTPFPPNTSVTKNTHQNPQTTGTAASHTYITTP